MGDKRGSRRTIRDLQVSLARYLLQFEDGTRLPSIKKLATSTHMSVGSVSSALNDLQNMGAVEIQRHGHLGSIVTNISIGKLWNLVEQGPFVIAMTLPMHPKFEGLATGLKKAFEKTGIDTYLIFIRGSKTRLKALDENRCHAAVMSALTANNLRGDGHEILMELPAGSWISGYGVFYRKTAETGGKKLRVAIDPDSFDHKYLTELEFRGQDVDFKYAPFVQFPRLLKNGELDAVLWTTDQSDVYMWPGIEQRPLSKEVLDTAGNSHISATLVTKAGKETVRAVLEKIIHKDDLLEIQQKIVSGEMIPEY